MDLGYRCLLISRVEPLAFVQCIRMSRVEHCWDRTKERRHLEPTMFYSASCYIFSLKCNDFYMVVASTLISVLQSSTLRIYKHARLFFHLNSFVIRNNMSRLILQQQLY
jgi:hypothetical protein